MMIVVTTTASTCTHHGLANVPMRRRSLVNVTSGTTANESCRLNATCESTSSVSTPRSPMIAITAAAGMMARLRLMSRRSHGRIRTRRKPSITICPASVPVMVLAWPAHKSDGEQDGGQAVAEQRREELVRLAQATDVVEAVPVERRGRQYEDRAVHEQRRIQCHDRVHEVHAARLALAARCGDHFAALHE